MGLDAWVCCNCIKEGKAPPHPFPALLVFGKTGEPTLAGEGQISLDVWTAHDKWYRHSCPHSGCLANKRLGNLALVAQVREFLENNSPDSFPMLLARVVYNGMHSGDWIAAREAPQLIAESRELQRVASDPLILEFANNILELAEASIATENPIVF